jgi:hypothetical protein
MARQSSKTRDPIDWLLEPADCGVRYLALRDLTEANPKTLMAAKRKAHTEGPIAKVLAKMKEEGYWERPGPGYNPKYRSAAWSITLLAQLGADIAMDERIATACSYLLDHALTEDGQFSVNGAPSGTIDCLQGNLCTALLNLGCTDARLDKAFEWMARSVTGEGVAPLSDKDAPLRYYAYKCGPRFACGVNGTLPCAWGAVKVMLAFSKLPKQKRTPLIAGAIAAGVDFLFSTDPAKADYPTRTGAKPNRSWWKFGFPVFYVTDLLQNIEALVGLGYGKDPRLGHALAMLREKQDAQGRWPLEYEYTGKTWVAFGAMQQPNKWVTLRALRVLQAVA